MTGQSNIVRTTDVIGKEVKSSSLEELGNIEEIVLDKISGQVLYVIIGFGGFMGFGEDYFAFPWKSIRYDKIQECFILNVDKSKLKKEYGFNKNEWPDMDSWSNSIDKNYM